MHRRFIIDRSSYTLNYVVDVCIISPRRTVTKYLYRSAFFNEFCKPMDGEVRPLTSPVNRKEPEAHSSYVVKMSVCMTHQLAGRLGRCIRRYWMKYIVAFRKRGFRVLTVNT